MIDAIGIEVAGSFWQGAWRHAERIKVEVLVVNGALRVSVVGQELFNLWVHFLQALAVDERVLGDEGYVLLIRLHANLDILVAYLLSPVQEGVPRCRDCILVGLPGVDPLLVLEPRLGLL